MMAVECSVALAPILPLMMRTLLALAVLSLPLSACGGEDYSFLEENGARGVVCDTDHVHAEVEWLIRNGWESPTRPTVVAVGAMPAQSSPDPAQNPPFTPRLISAWVTTQDGLDETYVWRTTRADFTDLDDLPILDPTASLQDVLDGPVVPVVAMGQRTEDAFPRHSNFSSNWRTQEVLDSALPMSFCFDGRPPGQS